MSARRTIAIIRNGADIAMMDLAYIKQMNREAAERAAEENLSPFVYWDESELDQSEGFPFPFIGDLDPEGWVEVETHFVDSSGYGQDDEPALSVGQFIAIIRDRIRSQTVTGWAIVEAGQFQVYVAEYHKDIGA